MDLSKDSFARIADTLHEGLYFVDRDIRITYWNKAAQKISGFSAGEVLGRSCSDNILTHIDAEGNPLCFGGCPLRKTIEDGQPREAQIYMHHKDGHRVPVSVKVSVLTDAGGKVVGGIELFADISKHYASEQRIKELEKLALLDELTQLANRSFLEQEIQKIFKENKRLNTSYGVFLMDIDHFKKFNDTYGHDVGDEVLKYVAKTFTIHSRPFDIYGRWGGEEFIGLICNTSLKDLEHLGNRLKLQVENSYLTLNGWKLSVTISIGATMVDDNDTRDTLLKRADVLLYQSKAAGRNCITMG